MKVVNNRVVEFRRDGDPVSVRLIYGATEADRENKHDAKGLIVALLLCLGCWSALGYFLLT